MKDTFKIIANPSNLFMRHEVWLSGVKEIGTYDNHANLLRSDVKQFTRKVKAFRKAEQAEKFIAYQMAVASFRGGVA